MAGAAAPTLKKLIMELGGNDAFIVAADADIDAAVAGAVRNRFYNCGQVCTSAKRILVDAGCVDEFVRKAKAAIEKLVVGSGLEKLSEKSAADSSSEEKNRRVPEISTRRPFSPMCRRTRYLKRSSGRSCR